MNYIYLLAICGWLPFAALARPTGQPSAPLDTVAGQARLVRKISQALCTRITNDHTLAISSLTPPQAMQLTQQLFAEAMQRDSVALLALVQEGARQNLSPQAVGQLLGRDAILDLAKTCPSSLPLITRLGQTEQVRQVAADKMPHVSAAEQKILQPLAADVCAKLTAANAKSPLANRTPSQRQAVFVQTLQQEFTTKRAQLLRYYSAAQLADQERRVEINKKICRLLIEQNSCSDYFTLLGVDSLTDK